MSHIETNENKRHIEAVVFDMDNTFFDFVEAKLNACNKVTDFIGKKNGEKLFDYFLRDEVGFEDVKSIEDYLKDEGKYERDVYEKCCKIYEGTKLESLQLYEGVEETLRDLKSHGLKLAVVTNAGRENLSLRLDKTGLSPFFETTVSRDCTGKAKPEPEPILSALENIEVEPEKALMVGDSIQRDIFPAKKLGMMTAYAEYGDRNTEEYNCIEPDLILKDIRDLSRIFNFE